MPKILAFSGSIRRDSWNRKLIKVAADATRAAGGDVTLIDLADYPLPLYDGDLEDHDGLPDNAQRLTYQNKIAAILAASPGTFGGMRMLPHLRQTLNTLGVLVLPGQVSVAHADKAFDEEGNTLMLKSPARLHALVLELVNTTAALNQK